MGTGFKENSVSFRSIGQNVIKTSKKYKYFNGYFGENSKHGNNRTRNIFTSNSLSEAKEFYDKIAFGGIEKKINNNLCITRMADGTVITMRKFSHSDGTPVIDINIKSSKNNGGVKSQKIHFVQEDN